MCRLLGYAAPSETTLEELIGEPQCALFRQMSRLHADGWGTAWTDGATGSVRAVRDTIPAQLDASLPDAFSGHPTRARTVHLRLATDGMKVTLENSHPFLTDEMAFAHNGAISPVGRLQSLVDPQYLEAVGGWTDSELYFALIRQNLGQGQELVDAVGAAVSAIRELYPIASLNALLLGRGQLIAVHSSENSRIPHREFEASGLSEDELPLNHLDGFYQMSYLRSADGATVFSSSGIDTREWTPLPPASVASVDLATLELRIQPLRAATVGSTV